MDAELNLTIWQSLITMVMAYAAISSGIIFGITEGAKKMFLTNKQQRDKYAPMIALGTAIFVAVAFWLWEGTYNPQGLAVYGLGSIVALFMSKGLHSDVKRRKRKSEASKEALEQEKSITVKSAPPIE